MSRPARCSDAARGRGDPLAGTAAPGRGWLLIEHPGPWAIDAFAGSGVDPRVQRRLCEATERAGVRILLVRRPGRAAVTTSAPQPMWAVRWSDGRSGADGTWSSHEDLLRSVAVLEGALAGSPADTRETAQTAEKPRAADQQPPMFLVCTHGRHDTCCAVRGRPVAAMLAEAFPDQTWECSHVGGDRFAANLLIVPDGTYYGAVDDTSAVDLVEDHLAGRVDARHLRGFTTSHPWEQAAIVEVHAARGPLGAHDVVVDPDRPSQQLGPARWRVHLMVGARETAQQPAVPSRPLRLTATVQRGLAEPHALTCRADRASSAARYDVALAADDASATTPVPR